MKNPADLSHLRFVKKTDNTPVQYMEKYQTGSESDAESICYYSVFFCRIAGTSFA
jgi:hypothetical protein